MNNHTRMITDYVTCWPEDDLKIEDCYWYHGYDFTRSVPQIEPDYYLEHDLHHFLLPEDMAGKSFLDIGTASGFFSFEMEKRGAVDVVSFDLAPDEEPDQIPYHHLHDLRAHNTTHRQMLRRSYWYAHKQHQSKARAAYGTLHAMPNWLGAYDVTLIGSVLQHLRDPFLAIQEADKHTKHTLIISEAYCDSMDPVLLFQAQPEESKPQFWTWWTFSSAFLVNAMKVLGYRDIEISKPFQLKNVRCGFDVESITVRGTK